MPIRVSGIASVCTSDDLHNSIWSLSLPPSTVWDIVPEHFHVSRVQFAYIHVYGATREEHDERLREVLQRLRDLGMTLNPEKCSFVKSSVKFLGHMIDSEGIKTKSQRLRSSPLQVAPPVPRHQLSKVSPTRPSQSESSS